MQANCGFEHENRYIASGQDQCLLHTNKEVNVPTDSTSLSEIPHVETPGQLQSRLGNASNRGPVVHSVGQVDMAIRREDSMSELRSGHHAQALTGIEVLSLDFAK